jgi:hypothetical protein
MEASGLGAAAMTAKGNDFFDGPGVTTRYGQTDMKNRVRVKKGGKGRINTFDDLKEELIVFKNSQRPSVFSNAPNRKVRAKITDVSGQGTEVGKYYPKDTQTRATTKSLYFVGAGQPLLTDK